MTTSIIYLGSDQLSFDYSNPRMVEYNFSEATSDSEITNIFWTEMATEELVMSILAHGFFQHEPLYVVKEGEDDRLIVVEGNRRLAAIKSILNPDIIENNKMDKYREKITPEIINQLSNSIPVLELENREDAWRYIGFKHVNGAAKWGSYAKAQYIATVKNNFHKSLSEIAEHLGFGDRYKMKKKYIDPILGKYIDENFRKYLGLEPDFENDNPVAEHNLKKLEQLMFWLYGSSSKKITPIIESQNPDLRHLNEVLGSREATEYLKVNSDLKLAYEICKGGNTVLYEALVKAKIALEKASSKIREYDGSLESLQVAADVANIANEIFERMDAIRNPQEYTKREHVAR